MAYAPKNKKRNFPVELPGEVKYRPPMGKPEDRMLAIATGRTEDGEKVHSKARQAHRKAA